MTDRRLLGFYAAMQPIREIAAGDAGVLPHAVIENTLSLPGMIQVQYQDTENIHDWAPTGYAGAAVWRVSLGESNVRLTGIVAGRPGQILTLLNVGPEDLHLAQNDMGSAVGNQLFLGWNFARIFAAGGSATFIYDPPVEDFQDFGCWRLIAAPGATFSNS